MERERIKDFIVNYINEKYSMLNVDVQFDSLKRVMDSLDMLEMLMVIEQKFNISMDDEDVQNWKTLDDVIIDVERYMNK